VLDREEGFGTAYNMMLKFYNFPVLYAPMYTFPIDNRRKTGFLTPVPSYEQDNGFQLALPYYWNLAPNYDLTTTPKYIEARGFQLNALFRYLVTPTSHGQVYISMVPNDRAFAEFREDTLENPGTPPRGVSFAPYLDELSGATDYRGFLRVDESARFNPNWSGHIHLNYVTDDYYFEDFGTAYSDVVANQLLNQADVEYQTQHWNFTGLLQGYQTLHLIGQAATPAKDQYSRLPELDFNSDFADLYAGADFSLGAQSVNFTYDSAFKPTTDQKAVGERLHARPALTRPFNGPSWYFNPQIALDSTVYAAQLPLQSGEDTREPFNSTRNLPIADVDSGLYLEHSFHWAENHNYLSTLEPRVFYLYVPYLNQDRYPNFDSAILPFTFPQLFDVNRFTSYDRLQNANQFSFGLTSRVINSNTLLQPFKLDFGFGYYLQSPQVCLDPNNCSASTFQYISPNSQLTPLVGQVTYSPWVDWSATASYAYDSSIGATNNAQIGINYNNRGIYIYSVKYIYVRDQNGVNTDPYGFSNSTSLISSGFAVPLSQHWSTLAYGQYNLSKERPDSFYGGLQYDTCCWTLRAIASRSFDKLDTTDPDNPVNVFKNAYYVQLQLKSLGSIGSSSPSNLLSSTLGGFDDTFR
jgi:LPS-assembly protein